MEKRISDEGVCNIIKANGHVSKDAVYSVLMRTAQDLQDARKELEEAKKDSVWRDAPEDATFASVQHCITSGQPYKPKMTHFYHREVPKTPKQELIDKFAEKNALAMKCANLSKEILEAFVKEYEEMQK